LIGLSSYRVIELSGYRAIGLSSYRVIELSGDSGLSGDRAIELSVIGFLVIEPSGARRLLIHPIACPCAVPTENSATWSRASTIHFDAWTFSLIKPARHRCE
jgi:hypothetical protein